MNKVYRHISGIILDFGLLIFFFFIASLIAFVIRNFTKHTEEENVPLTYYTVWILLLFTTVYFILKKRGLKNETFFSFLFLVVVGANLILMVTHVLIRNVTSIDNIQIAKKNFVGLVAVYYGGEDTYSYNSYLFIENDNRIVEGRTKLLDEYKHKLDKIDLKKYVFWQTAVAEGFSPKFIPNYNCCELSTDKLELYFTVGPLVIIECFIEAIKPAFLILIILVIFRLFNKPIFFKDFDNLKSYINDKFHK